MQLTPIIELLRREPWLRPFFFARAQSSLGTGAGYVGLLVLAYDRFESAWAISLILLADFLPTTFLGPLFGAAADRWSRRTCAVIGDVIRAVAFVAIGLVGGFVPMLALALLAGFGTGLFNPAVLAALPGMVDRERLPAATSLFGALADIGFTLGPALAALAFLVAGPETVMIVNGVTFAVSALVLARLPFGAVRTAERREEPRSLVSDARDGIRAVRSMPGVGVVIVASASLLLFAGLFNVGELLLATDELGAGGSGFAILIAIFGVGVTVGSLAGTSADGVAAYKHRYLIGLVLCGGGWFAASLAPVYAVAIPAFALAGVGNGFVLVHERLLLQTVVRDDLLGRVFGLKESASAWGWLAAFLMAGALFGIVDTRVLLACGGAGGMAIGAMAAWSLRSTWRTEPRPAPVAPALPELVDALAPERAANQASPVA
jgi:predicted MFS family arabinose efflux permease